MQLKPNAMPEFNKTMETKVLPLLRKQPGFKDEMVFMIPGGNEIFAVSTWEKKEHVDAYTRDTYPMITKSLETFLEGAPVVKTLEVTTSTFYKIGLGVN